MTYKNVLDASGETYPSNPSAGDYYIISVAGTISGTTYAVSDWAVYNGTGWAKIDNTQLSVTASLGVQKVGNDVRADLASNQGLALSTNSLKVDYDDSSIGIVSNKLAVKATGITNAMLAGSIADSKLSAISTAGKVSGAALTSLSSIPAGAGVVPIANLATGTATGAKFVRDDGTLAIPATGISGVNAAIMESTIVASPLNAQVWANMPAAVTEMFGAPYGRIKIDLTHATYYRIVVMQTVAGLAGADINLQYSTNNSTYQAADTGAAGELDVGSGTGVKIGAWAELAAGAKGDVWLRLVGKQGNGVADPAFQSVRIQFKVLSLTTSLLALTAPDLSVWDITIDNNGNLTRTKR
jgi:hypothetical protein